MLAVADIATALVVCGTIALVADVGTAAAALVAVPFWLVAAKLLGLYDRDHRELRHLTIDELTPLTLWAATSTAVTVVVLSSTSAGSVPLSDALVLVGAATITACALRALARFGWRCVTPPERTLIVGDAPLRKLARRKLELFSDIHVEVVGEQELASVTRPDTGAGWTRHVDRVIVTSGSLTEAPLSGLVSTCRTEQIKLSVVPPVRGMFGTAAELHHVADLPVVEFNTWDISRSTLLLKGCFDVALAAAGLVLLAPLFLLIALAIRLDGSGQVLFVQVRAGRGGRPFRMLKFRTMVSNAEALLPALVPFDTLPQPVFKLRNDPRVTRAGRFLRRSSLDELPQLLNVVSGRMSLVGPRPEQVELVERYDPEQRFRLAVKPGITGPMQVYGRGLLTFDERLAVERDYVENLSLRRDLRILGLTVRAVLRGDGAY